jgi:CheY-like chemotaxis protein
MNQVSDQPLVLVADDDDEFREEIIPEALRRLNARVLNARHVLEACLVVAEHDAHSKEPLDLIVLDMHMPRHGDTAKTAANGGIQFLRSFNLAMCPVVVYTAYPSYQNCVRAVQAGAVAYLPKMTQDTYDGNQEGGVDELVETCRALLKRPERDETRLPPDGEWLEENYDRLCQQYGGQWVAFVPASEAPAAGITGEERGGLVLVAKESRESLARFLAGRLPFLNEVPHIAFVPGREEGNHEGAAQ